jgi:hypothetical protein
VPDKEVIGGLEWEAEINFDNFDQSVARLNQMMNQTEKPLKKVEKALADTEKQAKKTGTVFDGLFKRFTAAGIVANAVTGAVFRVTAAFSQFARGIIKASSDLTELDSKARVVFNDSFPQVQKQVRNIAAEVGRASSTILQFATDMGAVISAFGITGPLLDQMSTQFAKLAVDLASFHNASDEEAFAALRSGITGETEPLKRFGIVLTDANLQLFAFEKGIKTKIIAMNQAQKTALRYTFIMDKTALAQGDAARTADTYANQSRRLGGEIKTLQEQLGRAVTPGLAKGLSVVSSAIQNVRIFISLLAQDIKSILSLLNVNIAGTTIGKSVKNGLITAVSAMNPVVGAMLQSGFKTPASKAIGARISAAKAGEASAQPALLDPLANFNSLGGASGNTSGGAGDALKKAQEAEEDLLQALGDQAEANKENIHLQRDQLKLREKLGVLTDKEKRELDQINRRLEFSHDVIQDMVDSWDDNKKAIEDSQKKLTDYRKDLKDMAGELAKSLKEVDDDVAKNRKDKIVELLKEQNDIKAHPAFQDGLSGDQGRRWGEIEDQLKGATPAEIDAARLIAGTADQPGMNDLAQISAEGQDKKNKLIDEEMQKRNAINASIAEEENNLVKLQSQGVQTQQEIVKAMNDRQIQQDKTFKLIEERTTAHVDQQILEFNRLKASLLGTPTVPTPTFAGGGPVIGAGTGTSDSIMARLSNGEYVIPAKATQMYRPILDAIRSRTLPIPRFAEGGIVNQNNQRSANITINNSGRAAEVFADPRRAKWHARTWL